MQHVTREINRRVEEIVPHHAVAVGLLFGFVAVAAILVETLIHANEIDELGQGLILLLAGTGAAAGISVGTADALLNRARSYDVSRAPRLMANSRMVVIGIIVILIVAPIVSGVLRMDVRFGATLLFGPFVVSLTPFYVSSTILLRRRLRKHFSRVVSDESRN